MIISVANIVSCSSMLACGRTCGSILTTSEKTIGNKYQKRVESSLRANTSLSAKLNFEEFVFLSHESMVYFDLLIWKQMA